MLPTPSTSHVNYDRIYEPAEDSYLLLDTLSSDLEITFLKQRFPSESPSPVILEVGSGSGVVLAFVTANADIILGRHDALTIGVDVNPFACQATKETVRIASEEVEARGLASARFLGCFNRDLTTGFLPGSLDLVIFNPPYVPTEDIPDRLQEDTTQVDSDDDDFARDSRLLALSYAGGVDGMEITNRLLTQLPDVLSPRGVAYVLLCAQNRPVEVQARICAWGPAWQAEQVSTSGKKAGWEKLCVIRIYRAIGED